MKLHRHKQNVCEQKNTKTFNREKETKRSNIKMHANYVGTSRLTSRKIRRLKTKHVSGWQVNCSPANEYS